MDVSIGSTDRIDPFIAARADRSAVFLPGIVLWLPNLASMSA
jgi:hypothetical protein